jgi:hypothetical protein
MWDFQYKHGDRPLDGYTIQRAAGRGGFGEVYYAVSDSGREVALKVVMGYEQIELRGITQCMNLKSPHLVSIFDVKHNAQGRPFVIMEFVNGPSLRQLLDESPAGLGEQKAAFFLREIAKGLSYLHDNGIVHRDLKPGNIFLEDGIVKIGDYGLSKAIAAAQHSAQTMTVGTVHYMAPEVGVGKYDRGIDIYALGAVLYEMLTGTVPFVGASPSEVLMKHLSAEPDLRNVSEPFATVIRRAMAKDPAKRYATVQEMVEAVFGAEHVRQSVSVFSPNDLSMIAGRVARNVGGRVSVGSGASGSGRGSDDPNAFSPSSSAGAASQDVWGRVVGLTDRLGRQLNERGGLSSLMLEDAGRTVRDPLVPRHRLWIAGLVSLMGAVVTTLVADFEAPWVPLLLCLLGSWGISAGLLLAAKRVLPQMAMESPSLQHLATGGLACLGAVLATPVWASSSALGATMLAVLAPFFFIDVRRWTDPHREDRVDWEFAINPVIAVLVLASVFDGSRPIGIGMIACICFMVQLLAAWEPKALRTGTTESLATPSPAAGAGVEPRATNSVADAPPPLPVTSEPAELRQAVSPFFRTPAVALLSLNFLGVAGLHRFYVGKTGTGLLWLLTLGLGGIGSLFDAIQLLRGRFRDSAGRRVLRWDRRDQRVYGPVLLTPAEATAARSTKTALASPTTSSSPRRISFDLTLSARAGLRGLAGAVAVLLLSAAFALGLAAAVDAPGMVASGIVGAAPRDAVERFWARHIADEPPPPTGPLARIAAAVSTPAPSSGARWLNRPLHPGSLPMLLRPEQMSMDELVQAARRAADIARELEARLERASNGAATTQPAAPRGNGRWSLSFGGPRLDASVSESHVVVEPPTTRTRPEWALPLRVACAAASVVLGLLGVALLSFARRANGGWHVLRGVVGVGLLGLSLLSLRAAAMDGRIWDGLSELPTSQAVERLVAAMTSGPGVIAAAVLILAALVVMVWPPKPVGPSAP